MSQAQGEREKLVSLIASFISDYRAAGAIPAKMQEAVLATFPAATSADFALGLVEANRRERGLSHG